MPGHKSKKMRCIPLEIRQKQRMLRYKKDTRRAAELKELRKTVGKRKLKQIRDKLKSKRLGKTKKTKKTKKTQRGGGCNVGTVDIPGFNVGPLSQASGASVGGINLAARRGTVYKNCSNGGNGPNHAMSGGRK